MDLGTDETGVVQTNSPKSPHKRIGLVIAIVAAAVLAVVGVVLAVVLLGQGGKSADISEEQAILLDERLNYIKPFSLDPNPKLDGTGIVMDKMNDTLWNVSQSLFYLSLPSGDTLEQQVEGNAKELNDAMERLQKVEILKHAKYREVNQEVVNDHQNFQNTLTTLKSSGALRSLEAAHEKCKGLVMISTITQSSIEGCRDALNELTNSPVAVIKDYAKESRKLLSDAESSLAAGDKNKAESEIGQLVNPATDWETKFRDELGYTKLVKSLAKLESVNDEVLKPLFAIDQLVDQVNNATGAEYSAEDKEAASELLASKKAILEQYTSATQSIMSSALMNATAAQSKWNYKNSFRDMSKTLRDLAANKAVLGDQEVKKYFVDFVDKLSSYQTNFSAFLSASSLKNTTSLACTVAYSVSGKSLEEELRGFDDYNRTCFEGATELSKSQFQPIRTYGEAILKYLEEDKQAVKEIVDATDSGQARLLEASRQGRNIRQLSSLNYGTYNDDIKQALDTKPLQQSYQHIVDALK